MQQRILVGMAVALSLIASTGAGALILRPRLSAGAVVLPSGPAVGVFTPVAEGGHAGATPATAHTTATPTTLTSLALLAPQDDDPGQLGLIGHELIRQAVLMAARDELRIPTWDAALGEEPPAGTPTAEVAVSSRGHLHLHLQVKPDQDLLSADFGYPRRGQTAAARIANYLSLISALDGFEQVGFARALRSVAGPGAGTLPAPAPATLPDGIDADQGRMDIFVQLAALRALHRLVQAHGLDAQACAHLSRGYATAALLTQHLWDDSSKVFAARALLYAERGLHLAGPGTAALRERAYARILVGFIDAGVQDLDQADSMPAPAGAPPPQPWVPTLRQFAAFDHHRLAEETTPGTCELAHLLGVVACESSMEEGALLTDGYQSLSQSPACYRTLAILCRCGGVGNLQKVTSYWPTALEEDLTGTVQSLPGLPVAAAQELAQGQLDHRQQLIRALRGGDTAASGIPRWSAVAQLIADDTLEQAWYLADMQVNHLGSDCDMGAYQLAIYDHPYRNLVFAFAINPSQEPGRLRSMLTGVPFHNFQPAMSPVLQLMNQIDPEQACACWQGCLRRGDPIEWDLLYRAGFEGDAQARLTDLEQASRRCPTVAIGRIRSGLATQRQLDDDRSAMPDAGAVREAIGQALLKQKRYREAEADLAAAIRLNGDCPGYEALAACRLAQHDEAGWLKTLQAYLATEERWGLSHAQVQDEIATHYMDQGDFDTAWPYASAAAETWAGWAMEQAATCAEGRDDLTQAATWWQRDAQRYTGCGRYWLQFILRTAAGAGQLQQAQAVLQQEIDAAAASTDPGELRRAGLDSLLIDDRVQAKAYLLHSLDLELDPFCATLVALMDRSDRDVAGARARLAPLLAGVRGAGAPAATASRIVGLARLVQSACASDTPHALDAAQVQALTAADANDSELAFLGGLALESDGQAAAATTCYRRAVANEQVTSYAQAYASVRLRALGQDPWLAHRAIFTKASAADADHM